MVWFDEDVTGFILDGISVTNGTASNLQEISAREYTAVIRPIKGQTASVLVLAGAAFDLSGNPSTASNTVSVTGPAHLPATNMVGQIVLFILLATFGARMIRRRY